MRAAVPQEKMGSSELVGGRSTGSRLQDAGWKSKSVTRGRCQGEAQGKEKNVSSRNPVGREQD